MAKLDTNSSHQVLPSSNYKSSAVLAGSIHPLPRFVKKENTLLLRYLCSGSESSALAFIRALSRSLQMAKLTQIPVAKSSPDSNYKSPAVLAGELSDDYNATTPPSLNPRSRAAVYLVVGLRDQWLH
ncbi:hypothetical protein CEXT_758211 [Caerostris extrusa]|uniref:Uncharacterized protein n=1 Tax=Caerostris extrusa TaxID=172846 RepID=A0AAV4PXL2_CAEEX|nr:hypothetical protein CEXT_758211 [Caerostris extrusa]